MQTSGYRGPVFYLLVMMALMALASGTSAAGQAEGAPAKNGKGSPEKVEKRPEMPEAKEVVEGAEKVAREQINAAVKAWRQVLRDLTARKDTGWVLFVSLVLFGCALLVYGWRLLNRAFLFLAAAVGGGVGSYMGLQACLVLSSQAETIGKAGCLLIGAAFGIALYLGTALRAKPLAWMLLVAAPFLIFSAYIAPSSFTVALLAAGSGLAMGLAAGLRQRAMVTVSTAMLGALMVVFSGGMLVHLLGSRTAHEWFDTVVGRPFVLAAVFLLLIFIGTDLQLILTSGEQK